MDANGFDNLVRSVASRRRIIQSLIGWGTGISLGNFAVLIEARDSAAAPESERVRRRHHHHHHHKPRCLDVGATCLPTTPTKPTRCCSSQCGCVDTTCTCRNATCSTTCLTTADCCQGQCAAGISMCF